MCCGGVKLGTVQGNGIVCAEVRNKCVLCTFGKLMHHIMCRS